MLTLAVTGIYAGRLSTRAAQAYLDGDPPPGWRASIDDHLNACDGCTACLEQIRQTVALPEQIDAIQHPTPAKASDTAEGIT